VKITTQLIATEFPKLFADFERAVPAKPWMRRANDVRNQIRDNRFMRDYLTRENQVALELARLSELRARYGQLPIGSITTLEQYEAMGFVAHVTGLVGAVDAVTANRILRRLEGALRSTPHDVRAFQFEMLVATHLSRRGFVIHLGDVGAGTFDLLAEKDGVEVEIECKCISRDKAQKIHQAPALRLFHLAHRAILGLLSRNALAVAVRIILPGRLDTAHATHARIVDFLKASLLSGGELYQEQGLCSIAIRFLDRARVPSEEVTEEQLRVLFKDWFGTRGEHVFGIRHRDGACLFVSLESAVRGDLVAETMDALKDAARDQLTRTRPGFLCAQFEALTSDQLQDIANDPTATNLRARTNSFFEEASRSHVACVSYFALGALSGRGTGVVSATGTSYLFDNRKCKFAVADLLKGAFGNGG
jgi:hypothetical protein